MLLSCCFREPKPKKQGRGRGEEYGGVKEVSGGVVGNPVHTGLTIGL